eukprot:g45926.t1
MKVRHIQLIAWCLVVLSKGSRCSPHCLVQHVGVLHNFQTHNKATALNAEERVREHKRRFFSEGTLVTDTTYHLVKMGCEVSKAEVEALEGSGFSSTSSAAWSEEELSHTKGYDNDFAPAPEGFQVCCDFEVLDPVSKRRTNEQIMSSIRRELLAFTAGRQQTPRPHCPPNSPSDMLEQDIWNTWEMNAFPVMLLPAVDNIERSRPKKRFSKPKKSVRFSKTLSVFSLFESLQKGRNSTIQFKVEAPA